MSRGVADLKPRAVALLCSLRQGPRTTIQLRNAIGDAEQSETSLLIADMMAMVARVDDDHRWYLTHDGLGWLQSHGLDAVPEARMYVAEQAGEVSSL